MANKPKLRQWQIAYILKAKAVRNRLCHKALAHKFGVSRRVIDHASCGIGQSIESWLARHSTIKPSTKVRRKNRDARRSSQLELL